MSEFIDSKEALLLASPHIKSIVDSFVTPKVKSLINRIGIDYKKNILPTESHFSEYFHRTFKKISVINTLVFNNSQKRLNEIYIPLTITQANQTNSKKKKYKIGSFPEELFRNFERILITDSAGMGKSTLMKKLFIDVIESKAGIPILIELRRLSNNKGILTEINEQLNSLNKNFDTILLLELLNEGDFYIILDGYDEIALNDKESVTKDLQDFIGKVPKNKFILTSRPENALASFGDFEKFIIERLKKKEAHELLRKYDSQGTISSLLIRKLEEKEMSSVDEFLVNPLLVSLLFTAFQHRQAIPFKKYLFYRQVYDANFETHDLTKGESYIHEKHSKLAIDDFHRVLRHIGYSCMKDQKIEFEKDELLKRIEDSKTFCVNLDFKPSDFLKDLISKVPLFTQDGNYYRWSHKSLQEYFAAQFIYHDSKGMQAEILSMIYDHPNIEKFINILDLYYDIDIKTFRNVIVRKVLTEYKNHYETYLQNYDPSIPKEDIDLRRGLCFMNKPYLFKFPSDVSERKASRQLDTMIETFFKEKTLSYAITFDNRTNCLNIASRKLDVVSLLYYKGLDCIYIKKDDLEWRPNINHLIDKPLNPIEITDNPSSVFNSIEVFKKVNSMIYISLISPYRFDFEKTKKTLEEIEDTIKLESSSDFILGVLK